MKRLFTFLVVFCFLLRPVRGTDFDLVCRLTSQLLEDYHFSNLMLDENLSKKVFDAYLDFLDPLKLSFTQEDVSFLAKKFRNHLHHYIRRGEGIIPAKEIFSLYKQRLEERVQFSLSLLESENFSFKSDDFILRDRDDAFRPKNQAEAKILWQKRIEGALLGEVLSSKLIQKNAKEKGREDLLKNTELPKTKLKTRYQRLLTSTHQATEEDVVAFFLNVLSNCYDPHTSYLSRAGVNQFLLSMQNSLVGIGALLSAEDDGSVRVEGIVTNGPADIQGGLNLNDKIIGVDSLNDGNMEDVLFVQIDKVAQKIRGKRGTEVRLKVQPADGVEGEVKFVVIRRDKVELKDGLVSAQLIIQSLGNGKVRSMAWVKIPSFYADFQRGARRVSEDLKTILERLQRENVEGIILDIRGNGGGALVEAQKIVGIFLGDVPVVQVVDRDNNKNVKWSGISLLSKLPLVVLTDINSASASEIIAGAFQDYGRAIIVGSHHTFGKGTVQQPLKLENRMPFYADKEKVGLLKVTVQKFYRVSGGSTQARGIVPDIILPAITDEMEIGEKWQKFPLPYDEIESLISMKIPFSPLIDFLRKRSQDRVSRSVDFSYILEDKEEVAKKLKQNQLSLNKKKRWKEVLETEEKRKKRRAEMAKRFPLIREEDKKNFEFYRLLLEDVNKKNFPLVTFAEDDSYMRRSKDELRDLSKSPKWPSLLDPVKRESILILSDLIEQNQHSQRLNNGE